MARMLRRAALIALAGLVLAPVAAARTYSYDIVSATGRYSETRHIDDESNDGPYANTLFCDVDEAAAVEYELDKGPAHGGARLDLQKDGNAEFSLTVPLRNRYVSGHYAESQCDHPRSCPITAGPGPDTPDLSAETLSRPPMKIGFAYTMPGLPDYPPFGCAHYYIGLPLWPSHDAGRRFTIHELTHGTVTLTAGGSVSIQNDDDPPDHETIHASWHFEVKLRVRGGLRADAGGPYTGIRARQLHLDGSRSRPRGQIDSYRWTFEPAEPSGPPAPLPPVARQSDAFAAQDAGCRPDHGGKTGKAPTVVPLCTIKAKLTVTDGGETDSDTTTITVKPRDWKTPVAEAKPERYTRWGQPQHGSADGSTFGLNVPGCPGAAHSVRDSYFCPLPNGDTWFGEAYTLNVVDDPKGPFDNHWYVKARPKFEIRRRALVNAYLYRGAGVPAGSHAPKEFYAANRDAGFAIDDFIRYVENHEGPGQGVPRSGHTQAIVEAIRNAPDDNDPQRVVESVVESSERAARREADKRLHSAGERVCLNTRDPLAGPWTGGSPFAWDPSFQDFRPLEGADFEGDPRDCAGS